MLGRSEALGMSKEGPMRLPRALVPTHTVSRLVGSDDGIVTSPYDLTFMQVTCRQAARITLFSCLRSSCDSERAHPDEELQETASVLRQQQGLHGASCAAALQDCALTPGGGAA